MFKLIEIPNHGKIKYQIIDVYGRHIAYLNNKDEAERVVRLLNQPKEYK